MCDSGILGASVRITRKGYACGALGQIVGIWLTKKDPSYNVKISFGKSTWAQALKRDDFELCKPWNILQATLEVDNAR